MAQKRQMRTNTAPCAGGCQDPQPEGKALPVRRGQDRVANGEVGQTPLTLSVHDVAARLGRSPDWVYRNWKSKLVGGLKFPPPILPDGELTWSRHHVDAWLDRQLGKDLKHQVAALRIAEDALAAPSPASTTIIESAQADLMARFCSDA